MKIKLTLLLVLVGNLIYAQEKYRNFYTSVKNADKKEGLALVLANNEYINIGKLNYAEEDGKHIIEALKEVDYDIEIGLNLNEKEMLEAINAFSGKLSNYKNAIIYYSGHGVELDGNNYLLPIDVASSDKLSFKNSAISLKSLFFEIDNPNIPKVVILDACRERPIQFKAEKKKVKGGGLVDVTARTNSIVIYSTANNTSITDENNFTETLSSNIKNGGCINEILRKTRKVLVDQDKDHLISEDGRLLDDVCFGDYLSPFVNIDDQDNDGIADEIDDCPNEKGPASNNGCPLYTKIYKKDRFLFSKNNLVGYTDTKGNTAIPAKFDMAWPFHENRARVLKDATWHYLDKSGEIITKKPYDSVTTFKNSTGIVSLNNKFSFVDSLGNEMVKMDFNHIKHSANEPNLIFNKLIDQKKKWGFMNVNGEIIAPAIYDVEFEFSEGIASSKRNGRMIFFNTKGEVLFSGNFLNAQLFSGGSAYVELPNKSFQLINRSGKVLKTDNLERKIKFNQLPSPYKTNATLKIKKNEGKIMYELLDVNHKTIISGEALNAIKKNDLIFILGEYDYLKVYSKDGILLKYYNKVASHIHEDNSKIDPTYYSNFDDEKAINDYTLGFWAKIEGTDKWKYYYLFTDMQKKLSSKGVVVAIENIPNMRHHLIVKDNKSRKYGIMNYKGEIIIPFKFKNIHTGYGKSCYYKQPCSIIENGYEVYAVFRDDPFIEINSKKEFWIRIPYPNQSHIRKIESFGLKYLKKSK